MSTSRKVMVEEEMDQVNCKEEKEFRRERKELRVSGPWHQMEKMSSMYLNQHRGLRVSEARKSCSNFPMTRLA